MDRVDLQETVKLGETAAARPPEKRPDYWIDVVKSDGYNRNAVAKIIARGLYRYFQEQRYVQAPR